MNWTPKIERYFENGVLVKQTIQHTPDGPKVPFSYEPEESVEDPEDDEPEDCSWCRGCGEGDYDGAACRKCHGTGVEPVEKESDV